MPLRYAPRYTSHKTVHALEIGADAPIVVREDGIVTLPIADYGFGSIDVKAEVVARYMPVAGDFLVQYEDGYRSISPRKAFLEGYHKALP